jgi:hypothetical protein
VEQTFKSLQHQAHIQNQLVQLSCWLKHGVLAVAVVVELAHLTEVLGLAAVVERTHTVYLQHLTLEQQKP